MNAWTLSWRAWVVALAGLAASPSWAAVDVYNQAPSAVLADTSAVFNNPSDPGFNWAIDSDMEAWAYFQVPADVQFNRISWYGSDADGSFAVDLFPASCFSCGANWAQTSGGFATNLLSTLLYGPQQVHKTALAGGLFEYDIDLPSMVTLSAGQPTYGLTVVNNYTAKPFSWAGSGQGSGFHLHYIVGQAMFLKAPGNLAFTLTDTTAISPVPEADSMQLSLLGLTLIWGVRRLLSR